MDLKAQKAIKEYVRAKRFLAVEGSVAGKTAIEQTLKKTAVSRKNIHFAKSVEAAIEIINYIKPEYIICNENYEDGHWTDLLAAHQNNNHSQLNSGFLLFSEAHSNTAESKLFQGDIDSIIDLPYTVTSLQSDILKVIIPKSSPSDYEVFLEIARESINFDLNKSFDYIRKAKNAKTKAYEALYLEGLLHLKSKGLDQARDCFLEALGYKPDHYNSLKELFNIYIVKKDRQRAYQIRSKMAEKFALNPDMIPDLSWLSLACAQYDDIIGYHKVFKSVHQPDSKLKNYIAAALAIYGKKLVKDKYENNINIDDSLLTSAFRLMDEASVICENKPLIFTSLIETLSMANNQELINNILSRAQQKCPSDNDIKALKVLINDKNLSAAESLKQAQEALSQGLKSKRVHEVILKRCVELHVPQRVLDENLDKAVSDFPFLENEFSELILSHQRSYSS